MEWKIKLLRTSRDIRKKLRHFSLRTFIYAQTMITLENTSCKNREMQISNLQDYLFKVQRDEPGCQSSVKHDT